MVQFYHSRQNLGFEIVSCRLLQTDGKDEQWTWIETWKILANVFKFYLILRLQKSPKNYRYVSGNLPTYPSPKLTFCLKWELSVNVGLGEG